jgi:CBS domain containing-hemolysin-like protein
MPTGFGLLVAFLLVLLNGFFVAAEFALVRVRSTRIAELAGEGKGSAQMALHAIRHLDAYLSATQLGITLASIGLGWIGEPAFAMLLEPLFLAFHVPEKVGDAIAFTVAYALVSTLHIVVGELAPKSWAIQRPESVTLRVAYPLHWFYRLFHPAVFVLNGLARLLLRLIGITPASEQELAHTEEEFRMLLSASAESGNLKESEVDLVKHVFSFADKVAREIMVPRVDMVYMDATWPLERNLEVMNSHTYTRFPLCEGGADRIIGMIHIRDLLRMEKNGGGDIGSIRRDILFVPEHQPIDQLLRTLQLRKMHMAAVIDEYGGTAGIFTLEDLLEQIVGEIHDEFEEPTPEVQPLGPNEFLVDGKVLLTDLADDYDLHIPTDGSDADTIGGWVLDMVSAVPAVGTMLETESYCIEAHEMDGQRVRKVLILRRRPPAEGTEAPAPISR